MSVEDIGDVVGAFRAVAERAREAGFRGIEVYAAHGFLLHQFHSPLANRRSDGYGGVWKVAAGWRPRLPRLSARPGPRSTPLVFHLSVTDWHPDGWQVQDTIHLARRLTDLRVDAIACSSGGIAGRERPQGMVLGKGYQLPLAAQVKKGADIATIGVGLLWDPQLADRALEQGEVDLVALARELLENPNWTLHAAHQLGVDQDHHTWPPEFG